MPIILDIETEPLAREIIEATLPDFLREPVMPEELRNPPAKEFVCPDYGLADAEDKLAAARIAAADLFAIVLEGTADGMAEKEVAKIQKRNAAHMEAVNKASAKRDEAAAKVEAIKEKRANAILEAQKKSEAKAERDRQSWRAKIDEQIAKVFADAALDARTARVKLIVIRDTGNQETIAFLFENDAEKIALLTEPDAFPGDVDLRFFATEAAMILAFLAEFERRMDAERQLDGQAACVGYWIKDFDLPMIYRRAWMNGKPVRPLFRKGRFWSEEIIDLHEEFSFGDKSFKMGGLDGLAKALKCNAAKTGEGSGFSEWYNRNPVEGVTYGINDVELTEEAARKIGVI